MVELSNLLPFLTQLFSSTPLDFRSCPSPRSLPTYLQELGGFSHEDSYGQLDRNVPIFSCRFPVVGSFHLSTRTMMRSRPNKTT